MYGQKFINIICQGKKIIQLENDIIFNEITYSLRLILIYEKIILNMF